MTSMTNDPRYGASFTAKSGQANPDDILRQIMEEMPSASEKETWSFFRAEILKSDEMIEACIRCYHVNARQRLTHLVARKNSNGGRYARPYAQRATTAAAKSRQIEDIMILDHVLPNGKYLRDVTFRYVAKVGGAFSRIAKMGRPEQIVGEVLSNAAADAAFKK